MSEVNHAHRIVIGVTGHRILTEIETLTEGIDTALDALASACGQPPACILSCLAEGADRLVAERAMTALGASLSALLPMDRDSYMREFASDRSRQEFLALLDRADEIQELPPMTSAKDSYEQAGRHLVDRSHVLVAVWDGEPSQDRGGTGWVVARAREQHLPMVWVHAGNRRLGTEEPTSLGEEQGRVTYENLDGLKRVTGTNRAER